MALVQKKKNGTASGNYYLVIYIKGKQKWISTGTADKKKALQFESDYKRGALPRFQTAPRGIPVTEYAASRQGENAAISKSAAENRAYAINCLQKYCDQVYGGPVALQLANVDFCKRFIAWLSERYSPSTAAARFGFLKSLLAEAALKGEIPANPCEGLSVKPAPGRNGGDTATVLDARHAGEFLGFCRAHMASRTWPFWYAYYAWATSVHTGMKRGELLSLSVSDVDFKNRTLYIGQSPASGEDEEEGGAYSPQKRARCLYITPSLDILLAELIARLNRGGEVSPLLDRNNPKRYLFCTENYSPISPQCLSMCVEEAADAWAAEGDGCFLRLYDARHTCASILYHEEGLPIDAVSAFLGHKSTKTTALYLNKLSKNVTERRLNTAAANLTAAISVSARKYVPGKNERKTII